jgi:hypothetical protein
LHAIISVGNYATGGCKYKKKLRAQRFKAHVSAAVRLNEGGSAEASRKNASGAG